MHQQNDIQIGGQVSKLYPIKYTINNIAINSFILNHSSQQIQLNNNYNIKCKIYCIMFDQTNEFMLSLLDQYILVTGFLAFDNKTQIILHVKDLQLIKINN